MSDRIRIIKTRHGMRAEWIVEQPTVVAEAILDDPSLVVSNYGEMREGDHIDIHGGEAELGLMWVGLTK